MVRFPWSADLERRPNSLVMARSEEQRANVDMSNCARNLKVYNVALARVISCSANCSVLSWHLEPSLEVFGQGRLWRCARPRKVGNIERDLETPRKRGNLHMISLLANCFDLIGTKFLDCGRPSVEAFTVLVLQSEQERQELFRVKLEEGRRQKTQVDDDRVADFWVVESSLQVHICELGYLGICGMHANEEVVERIVEVDAANGAGMDHQCQYGAAFQAVEGSEDSGVAECDESARY